MLPGSLKRGLTSELESARMLSAKLLRCIRSAAGIGSDLKWIATYDERMADAAQALGMSVRAPA